MAAKKRGDKATIIIRREEVVEGGHHGGAWKVAYADFVTAMMAFFLLMWLLNATTEEQRRGLADYFSPNNVMARTTSGFGQPFGGTTPNIDGSLASTKGAVQVVLSPPHPVIDSDEDEGDIPARQSPKLKAGAALVPTAREGGTAATLRAPPADADPQADPARLGQPDLAGRTDGRDGPGQGAAQGAAQGAGQGNAQGAVQGTARDAGRDPLADARTAADRADAERQERQALERAALAIQDAVRADPALAAIAQQLQVDITPEGLRIQIVDADRQPMFATGSSALNDRARALLAKVAPVLLRLPEGVSIAGHTDAQPYRGAERSNWDLSAERANATRRLLTDAGLPEARIRAVAGHADREPLVAADRMAAANRRVAILVLRDLPLRDAQPGAAPRGAPAPDALTPGVPARTQSSR
jgi:chemotaxis protein MotB